MSHFITNTKKMENSPMFSLPTKEIVMPQIKKYIRVKPDHSNKSTDYRKESKLLDTICDKLRKNEFEEIHNENVKIMDKKFSVLKNKMSVNIKNQSVEKIFNCTIDADKLDIRAIVNMRADKIELEKKYGNRILMKMENYQEAEQISEMKRKYQKWQDDIKNDRCSSPIFKKMAYLLERAHKENIIEELPIKRCRNLVAGRFSVKTGQQNKSPRASNRSYEKLASIRSSPYKRKMNNWGEQAKKFSIYRNRFDTLQQMGQSR